MQGTRAGAPTRTNKVRLRRKGGSGGRASESASDPGGDPVLSASLPGFPPAGRAPPRASSGPPRAVLSSAPRACPCLYRTGPRVQGPSSPARLACHLQSSQSTQAASQPAHSQAAGRPAHTYRKLRVACARPSCVSASVRVRLSAAAGGAAGTCACAEERTGACG